MFKHYLLVTWRQLWRRKLFTLVSLLSLILGLTVFCLSFLNIRYEMSFNTGWKDSDSIYRMTSKRGGTNEGVGRTIGFSDEFIINITNYLDGLVSGYAEIFPVNTSIDDDEGDYPVAVSITQPGFLDIFKLDVVAGSMEGVMGGPGFIALEQSVAESYFGTVESAVGQLIKLKGSILISGLPDGPGYAQAETTEFEVAAVFELPEPVTSTLEFEAIVQDDDYSNRLVQIINGNRVGSQFVWMRLDEGVDVELVNDQLDRYLDEYLVTTRSNLDLRGERYSDLFDFKLQALDDIYFGDVPESPRGDLTRLITISVVSFLVLVAGCSNVISLGFAAAMERRREVGIRKSVGALQRSIASQYLGESVALSILALIPTIALVYFLHPAFANMISINQMPVPGITEIVLMLAICIGVGLVNGVYPAIILARVKPVTALKTAAVQSGGKRVSMRSILVGMQFGFSIILLIVTSGLYFQLWTTRHQPVGFTVENLVVLTLGPEQLAARINSAELIAAELLTVPGIAAAKPNRYLPFNSGTTSNSQYEIVQTRQEDRGAKALMLPFENGLFEFFGIPLLAGRDLNPAENAQVILSRGDNEVTVNRAVINRAALQALDITDPEDAIGTQFFMVFDYGSGAQYMGVEVLGVVENSMLSSLRQKPAPELYLMQTGTNNQVLIKYDPEIEGDVLQLVNGVSQDVTGSSANMRFLEDQLFDTFTQERRESMVLLLCGILALLMSCMGLYGLVSVALKTQVKEIGIRKVLGSTTVGIVFIFLKRFSLPVLVANLVAWPVAAYFVLKWIERFPYQLDKIWLVLICLVMTFVVLFISWLTVGMLSCRAASIRPVKSLRYE